MHLGKLKQQTQNVFLEDISYTLNVGRSHFDKRCAMVVSSLDELREKLAHIDQMLADHDRERQEIRLAPWQLALTGMGTGAALFAAGAAFYKLLSF